MLLVQKGRFLLLHLLILSSAHFVTLGIYFSIEVLSVCATHSLQKHTHTEELELRGKESE